MCSSHVGAEVSAVHAVSRVSCFVHTWSCEGRGATKGGASERNFCALKLGLHSGSVRSARLALRACGFAWLALQLLVPPAQVRDPRSQLLPPPSGGGIPFCGHEPRLERRELRNVLGHVHFVPLRRQIQPLQPLHQHGHGSIQVHTLPL